MNFTHIYHHISYRDIPHYPKQLSDLTSDMVAGDITVSSEREDFMDFSTPFMTIGLTILFKKPAGPEDQIFSFMSALSTLT